MYIHKYTLIHSLTLTHTHSLTRTHSHLITDTHSLSHTYTLTHSHTHTRTHTFTHSYSHTHTNTGLLESWLPDGCAELPDRRRAHASIPRTLPPKRSLRLCAEAQHPAQSEATLLASSPEAHALGRHTAAHTHFANHQRAEFAPCNGVY